MFASGEDSRRPAMTLARVKFTGEDRTGQFWVADSGGLEAFDRETGKVTRHIPFSSEIG